MCLAHVRDRQCLALHWARNACSASFMLFASNSVSLRAMARAKLHHFVPQFYLRRWCDSKGKLWVYPLEGKEPFRAAPQQFAAETHLYTPKAGADAVRGDTEEWMAGWESRFAEVWPEIVDRCDDPRTRANVARFLRHSHRPAPEKSGLCARTKLVLPTCGDRQTS